jgi:uncharacterized protein YndB with AHSA1/START domain
MSKDKGKLVLTQAVAAPPEAAYYAFTNEAAIQGWLCDNGQVNARENGRIYLYWNRGYYGCGEFTALEPDTSLAFAWRGKDEPGPTEVHVSLAAEGDDTLVTVTHSGIGEGEAWQETRGNIEQGWTDGLENLKAVLETGLDKRLFDRPLLGVYPAAVVDEESATELGLPVTTGIRISSAAPGTKAEAAGLQANDVLFSVDGTELTEFRSIGAALADHKVGDTVELVLYRDGARLTMDLALSSRPIPEVPDTAQAFAAKLRETYAELDGELDALLAGVSDKEAATPPAPEKWSVVQVLAHLLATERVFQVGIALQMDDKTLAGFPNNPPGQMAAIIGVNPTLADMVGAWKKAEAETVALVENLPDGLVARKADYIQLGNLLLTGLPGHTRTHLGQIQRTLEAVRGQ